MKLDDLAKEYNSFVTERNNIIKGLSSDPPKKLLMKLRNSGKCFNDPTDREILSAWCRDIGDTIYKITGEYPQVRISPFSIYAAISAARTISDLRRRIDELISIAVLLQPNERNNIISEIISNASLLENRDNRFELLEKAAKQLPELNASIISTKSFDEAFNPEFQKMMDTNFPMDSIKLSLPQQIPFPPYYFVGRDEEINEILNNIMRGKTIICLNGSRGIGKTSLAKKVAKMLERLFPDGQIFIDLRGTSNDPINPIESISCIIHAYAPTIRIPDDVKKLKDMYFSLLKGRKVLLLFDDVINREQIEPLIPPSSCATIITSCEKFKLSGMVSIDLCALSLSDACDLLLLISKRIGDQAEDLSKLCDCIPLALRNAASSINEKSDLDVIEYIRMLDDAKTKMEIVDATLNLSDNLLSKDKQELWHMLSAFPADFNLSAAKHVWNVELDLAIETINELVRWNLVEQIPSKPIKAPNEERYYLHEVARNLVSSIIDLVSYRISRERHAEYYKGILSEAELLYEQKKIADGLCLFDCEWPNIKAGQAWAADIVRKAEKQPPNEPNREYEIANRLCRDYVNVGIRLLYLRIPLHDWICWLEVALSAVRKLKDCMMERTVLENLGDAYRDLCDSLQAIEFYKNALFIDCEIKDRLSDARNLCKLGNSYYDLGNNREAISYLQQSLIIAQEIKNKQLEVNALAKLGKANYFLGNSHLAIENLKKALNIYLEIGDSKEQCKILDGLGNVYSELGEASQANEFLEKSLAIAHNIKDRQTEASTLSNLGDTYYSLGEIRRSIDFLEKSLEIAEEIGNRQIQAKSLFSLGVAYNSLSENQRAIKFHEQSLALARNIGDRVSEARTLLGMGACYHDLGDIRQAIAHFEQSLAISRQIDYKLGEAKALGSLGNASLSLGNPSNAIEFYEKSLSISREMQNRRGVSKTLANLGNAYDDIGRPDQAIEFYEQSLNVFRDIGASQDESKVLINLGMTMSSKDEFPAAIKLYGQSLEIARMINDKQLEGDALLQMSLAFEKLGDRKPAIECSMNALKIFEEIGDLLKERYVKNLLRQWQK